MARILVAGGGFYPELDANVREQRRIFGAALGNEIVLRGHVLLGGCQSEFDALVAKAAADAAKRQNLDPRRCIKSWVQKTTIRTHSLGEITRSQMGDWAHVPRGLVFPEQIYEADVVVIVGGRDGTQYAASWARLANKPIAPVATFGGAADEIFTDELASFERRYASKITLDEFRCLDRVLPDESPETIVAFAKDVISLAERLIRPSEAFVIMSFAQTGELKDAYNTLVRVCQKAGYLAFKVDDQLDSKQRIVPAIVGAIRKSAFVIADVTDPRPNVYYELGYANALGKDIVLTAKEGTKLPFDVFDVPTLYWDCQDTLEKKLEVQLKKLLRQQNGQE